MISSAYRAIIFDFDGTLADSYAAITASVNHVRAAHKLTPLAESEVRKLVGFGLQTLLHEVIPGGGTDADVALYRSHYLQIMERETHLLPGVLPALEELQRRGLWLAVCSNKNVTFTRKLCVTLGIAPFFEAILGPEDVSAPKPDPAMICEAMKRLGVTATECLYVGDMAIDVETARAAGVTVWVVPSGSHDAATLSAAGPDRILGDMGQLPRALFPPRKPSSA
jgi:2-phosphoglycolate phosphatase